MPPPQTATPDVVNINAWVQRQLEQNARRLAMSKPPTAPLETAVRDWWGSLPLVTRNRRYQLTEISDALFIRNGKRFADRHITAVLESASWTAGRSWTRAGRNRRFWTPPTPHQGARP